MRMKIYFLLKFLIQAFKEYQKNQLVRLAEYVRTDKGFFLHNYVRVYDQILNKLKDENRYFLYLDFNATKECSCNSRNY